jgi:hypothetical protein
LEITVDLKSYFNDKRAVEAELERSYPGGVVYVTSLFHRERNSTPGCTLSASWSNAARVLTDGTHRLATPEEVDAFLKRQQENLRRNTASEQMNKKQYIVVVDQHQDNPDPVFAGGIEPGKPTAAKGRVGNGKE